MYRGVSSQHTLIGDGGGIGLHLCSSACVLGRPQEGLAFAPFLASDGRAAIPAGCPVRGVAATDREVAPAGHG